MAHSTRRSFLGAAAAVSFSGPVGAQTTARVIGANDAVRLGVIGVGSHVKIGGKGRAEIRDFGRVPGVRIVALCDVDQDNLDPEVQRLKDHGQPVAAYTDIRKLLESKDIDGVIVTTPNHWHALATVWACQAGKDVYVQKPCSHNLWEGRKMIEAANRYNRIVACTHGPRERNGMGEAFAWARSGKLGAIQCIYGINYRGRDSIGKVTREQPIPKRLDYDLWSGPAPLKPVMREYLHYDWHWIWDYGNGDLGNMGIHHMDGCRYASGQKTLPPRVLTVGGRLGYDDDGETPNTMIVFLDYRPAPIIFEVRGLPSYAGWRSKSWEKLAKLTMDQYYGINGGVVMRCENGYVTNNQAFDNSGKLLQTFEPTNEAPEPNFIRAVRSRKTSDLVDPVPEGHLSAGLMHMANISHRVGSQSSQGEIRERVQGQRDFADSYERLLNHLYANRIDLDQRRLVLGADLRMDPATEQFTGEFSERANPLTRRVYREPFVIPERI